MANFKQTFKSVKQISWNRATVSFYVLKRKLVRRKANYEILQVNVDESLRKKLRRIAANRINDSNTVKKYDFTTADLDNDLLGLPVKETDLQDILERLQSDERPSVAGQYSDLLGAWLYIARLDLKGRSPLFSARRISEGWTTKKVTKAVSMIFQNDMLVDLERKDIFRIDGLVDFFTYGGTIFIADKKNFEAAMNFREGMERNRDAIVKEFGKLELFEDAKAISTLVGNHMNRLRRLSQVRKAGYYKDPNYLRSLRKVCEEEKWEVTFTPEGKIVANEENIDVVLKVLNNDRLTSKINAEDFDVDVKHKL